MWCKKLTTKGYRKIKETGDLSSNVLNEQGLQTYYITSGWQCCHSSIQSWCSHDLLAVSFCLYIEDSVLRQTSSFSFQPHSYQLQIKLWRK